MHTRIDYVYIYIYMIKNTLTNQYRVSTKHFTRVHVNKNINTCLPTFNKYMYVVLNNCNINLKMNE